MLSDGVTVGFIVVDYPNVEESSIDLHLFQATQKPAANSLRGKKSTKKTRH